MSIYIGAVLQALVMLLLGGFVTLAMFSGVARYALRDPTLDLDEKPNFANSILPIIKTEPMALALFWGCVVIGACIMGSAVVSRII
ncbi:MAG: hypothetical protein Tsb002_01060 [Wenzhouxiangellaceae bacterium]